ncbi:MAG: HAD family hydrolase [Terrimicrobiaceae bacterium]|nr:HAD family hydrolase [Terrimicrobiaceae bacterium]
MIRNLLLDWSGTLADDLGPVLTATNAIFREYGRNELTREEFRASFRLPYSEFYAELLPEATLEGLQPLYEKFFAGLHDDVGLMPGALEFIEFCGRSGRRIFLLSTIKASHFDAQARRLGVRDAFEHPYVDVMDKRGKIREILATHALDPGETAFVGDMVHDIETARHGGVLSIAVLTGFDSLEKLAPAGPDVIVTGLAALQKLLGGMTVIENAASANGSDAG